MDHTGVPQRQAQQMGQLLISRLIVLESNKKQPEEPPSPVHQGLRKMKNRFQRGTLPRRDHGLRRSKNTLFGSSVEDSFCPKFSWQRGLRQTHLLCCAVLWVEVIMFTRHYSRLVYLRATPNNASLAIKGFIRHAESLAVSFRGEEKDPS